MPVEPPQNAEYLIAGYVITAIILAGYLWLLCRRARKSGALGRDSYDASHPSG